MTLEKEVVLENCLYSYAISNSIGKYMLHDTTFSQDRTGNYGLARSLGKVPNSSDGSPLKTTISKDLTGFKFNITDKSSLRFVDIFESEDNKILQEKFYFLADSPMEYDISIRKRV